MNSTNSTAWSAHLSAALISGIPLLLTFLVPLEYLPRFNCIFQSATGLPCPFCGISRSFWAISGGNWTYAIINYPLVWIVYLGLFFVFIRSAGTLLIGAKLIPGFRPRLANYRKPWMAWTVAVLILSNWGYRVFMGFS